MDERIDILDSSGEQTGRVAWKSEAHRLGLWHRCFHCWIVSPEIPSGGPYLFAQRRAAGKETWPNRLDVTVAGHLGAGEGTLEGGLREIEEEIGLTVNPDELIPLGTRMVESRIPAGLDRELHEVFLLVRFLSPKDLRLQEEEVAAIVRLQLQDVEALREGEDIPAEKWRGEETSPASVSLSEFVPGGDDYLPRIARAAREVLLGGRPGNPF
ncbi:MAG: NUDIX domain-containing protein [Actinomycetota bacterium]|nr:NUDIX domain-containing protein [Actinomycetota bacterium]